jgi:hypothetical protein
MPKIDKTTAEIEMLCNEWALGVIINDERSPLGYPSETVEAKIKQGTTTKSGKSVRDKTPHDIFAFHDPRLTLISHALFKLPAPWGHAIWCRHLAPVTMKAPGGDSDKKIELRTDTQRGAYYRKQWGCGSSAYYANLKAGYAYILGVMDMVKVSKY